MIFGVLNPEETWHHQLVHLPTSPVYCSHCTLGNPNSRFINIIIFIHILHIIYVISKENKLLPTTPEKCQLSILWNANLFHLTEGNVAFHHALLKFSPCRNKTLPQLVRIAYRIKPVNYRIWRMLHERVYRIPIRDTDKLWKHLLRHGLEFSTAWWTIMRRCNWSVAKKTGSMYPCRR